MAGSYIAPTSQGTKVGNFWSPVAQGWWHCWGLLLQVTERGALQNTARVYWRPQLPAAAAAETRAVSAIHRCWLLCLSPTATPAATEWSMRGQEWHWSQTGNDRHTPSGLLHLSFAFSLAFFPFSLLLPSVHSFDQHLLSTLHMPGNMLGLGDEGCGLRNIKITACPQGA